MLANQEHRRGRLMVSRTPPVHLSPTVVDTPDKVLDQLRGRNPSEIVAPNPALSGMSDTNEMD